jgi:hypothetical protein
MKQEQHPLDQVAKFIQAEASHRRVAVIFDIDSTLFSVSPRNEAILRSLAATAEFQQAYPEAAKVLSQVKVLPTDWGVRATVERLNMQVDDQLIETLRKYWRDAFFSNHYLDHDEMYPSASEYVNRLAEMGAEILYLTGRNDRCMRSGTLKGLAKWKFPLRDESLLLMKPDAVEPDEEFKVTALKALLPQYDHIWFFENEPVIIDAVRKSLPSVQIVFVDTVHSGRAEAPKDLLVIQGNYQWPFM